MTTIVYRDGMLACDSQVGQSDQWIQGATTQKIVRRADGAAIASSGNWCDATKMARWFCDGEAGDPPDGCASILAYPDGTFRVLEDGKQIEFIFHVPHAYVIGSGFPVALGALMAGADAREAVEIACSVDPYSGGFVHAVRVSGPDLPVAPIDAWQLPEAPRRVDPSRADFQSPSFWLNGVLP